MLARHRDPRVVPIEVWDLVLDGVPLYRIDRGPGFGAALGRVAEALLDGCAASESGARYPEACRGIRRVVLAGGAAGEVSGTSARLPAERAEDADACAERGGRAILARAGRRGLVVDLGQSRLKIASDVGRRVHVRDLAAIPVSRRPVDGRGREALRAFVVDALRDAAAEALPEAIVLALPCEISADGTLGTCSYPWREGDDIFAEILARAGLSSVPTWLVNDAELAALGVAERGPTPETTLVLTVGWGVGGALIQGGA